MCRCFVIGCYNLHRKVDYEKEGLSPPPERVPCSTCGMPMPTEYYRTVTCCCICFIPLCPLEYSRPYLICKGCGMQINNINRTPCRSCNVAVPHGYRFCPECGSEVK
ncbi:hypothetical protein TUBRATIS_008460 [Tubulinosema ratisbonensis]|uniref:Zinc-ribbon 15 domain-containing protein n=1 Tax=Tubulinosema ratisbonensis TaxID=291195 RepID=A0A437AN86_9MICR|nr:hypothetical protein TUBRATIS_008460 [Tubulinosema ratisbonensis]